MRRLQPRTKIIQSKLPTRDTWDARKCILYHHEVLDRLSTNESPSAVFLCVESKLTHLERFLVLQQQQQQLLVVVPQHCCTIVIQTDW